MTLICVLFMFLVEKVKPLTQHLLEARGPGGCLLLIDILTDNNSRSHQEIKRLLVKNGSECACCVKHRCVTMIM